MCGADDDVGDGRCNADLDAGVALLGQLALEELVQLGIEDTVCGGVLASVLCAQIFPAFAPSVPYVPNVCAQATMTNISPASFYSMLQRSHH